MNKKEFDKLDNIEKRKWVAKDVLKRIANNNVVPCPGVYFNNRSEVFGYDIEYDPEDNRPAKGFLNDKPCEVCAKGSLMVSWVGSFGGCSVKETASFTEEQPPEDLEDIFGAKLLDLIEIAFEACIFEWHDDDFQVKFVDEFYEGNLEAIMETIAGCGDIPHEIENDGIVFL